MTAASSVSAAGPRERPGDGWRWLRRVGLVLLAAIPTAALLVFFCYPVLTLLGRGLFVDGRLDLSAFGDVFARPRMRSLVAFTIWQAAASAALCLLLGIPGAYLLYRKRFPGRAVLRAVLTMPLVLPTVVVALAFKILLTPGGPLGSWGLDETVAAILAAHVFLNYGVVVRTVGSSWAVLDDRPLAAARSLGATPLRAFLTVTLPALGPAIAGAFTMVFLFCATSFGIVLILGAGRLNTLETEIYRQTQEFLDLRTAAVLSIAQLVLVTLLLVVVAALRRRTDTTQRLDSGVRRRTRFGLGDAVAAVVTTLVALAFLGVLGTLVLRSLREPGGGFGLANYAALGTVGQDNLMLVPATTALANSLRAAALAAVLAVIVGVALSVVLARRPRSRAARRLLGAVDGFMMLPLGVSAVTVGFGFLIALDSPPLDLRSSPLLVPIAQALVALPLVVRMVLPVLRGIDDRLRQAAASAGAPPLRVWWTVDLPIARRAFGGAAAFAFAVALGEFGATSFLATPQRPTLPVLIARLIGRPGELNTGMALAAAVLLALLCALVLLVVEAVSGANARIGGF